MWCQEKKSTYTSHCQPNQLYIHMSLSTQVTVHPTDHVHKYTVNPSTVHTHVYISILQLSTHGTLMHNTWLHFACIVSTLTLLCYVIYTHYSTENPQTYIAQDFLYIMHVPREEAEKSADSGLGYAPYTLVCFTHTMKECCVFVHLYYIHWAINWARECLKCHTLSP